MRYINIFIRAIILYVESDGEQFKRCLSTSKDSYDLYVYVYKKTYTYYGVNFKIFKWLLKKHYTSISFSNCVKKYLSNKKLNKLKVFRSKTMFSRWVIK